MANGHVKNTRPVGFQRFLWASICAGYTLVWMNSLFLVRTAGHAGPACTVSISCLGGLYGIIEHLAMDCVCGIAGFVRFVAASRPPICSLYFKNSPRRPSSIIFLTRQSPHLLSTFHFLLPMATAGIISLFFTPGPLGPHIPQRIPLRGLSPSSFLILGRCLPHPSHRS